MTINLSEHAGGGNIYISKAMTFNGIDASYYTLTGSVSGQTLSVFGWFTINSITNNADMYRFKESGGVNIHSLGSVNANNHATPTAQGRYEVLVRNASNVNILRLLSITEVNDGLPHSYFFSFNADTAAFVFEIDGVAADDVGNSRRVTPVTGTLHDATGDGTFAIGSNHTANAFWDGDIGAFGFCSAIVDPADIFDADNNPIDQDTDTWPTFGGVQPWIYHPKGDLANNLGSIGYIEIVGPVAASQDSLEAVPMLGLPTIGDAVAADIATDKIAWVDGIKIIGESEPVEPVTYDKRILSWEMGSGAAGEYTLDIADAQYAANGVAVNSQTVDLDGDGWLSTDNGSQWLNFSNIPAKTTNCRRYIYTIKFDGNTVYPDRFQFLFNYQSATDCWYGRIIWNTNYMQLVFYDVDGSEASKGSKSFTTLVGLPTTITVVMNDYGDLISISADVHETDSQQDVDAGVLKYYISNRRNKNENNFGIQIVDSDNSIHLHSVDILDIPD